MAMKLGSQRKGYLLLVVQLGEVVVEGVRVEVLHHDAALRFKEVVELVFA